ncbi:Spherulation-specific family 4-domain-containing protein [Aspergillus alliaceus]|uniref:Spherulation-specific family 4-domain-containing protein n=1 Tax=Petromyces alliaceus TaxID=209559 RepID=A0A5N7CPJ1_PETAA|nr:Spherulation-specific family 4-domain-containing protein [Aspergillus alliaceus]
MTMNVFRSLSCLVLLFQVAQSALIPIRQYDSDRQTQPTTPDSNSESGIPSLPWAPSSAATPSVPQQAGSPEIAGTTELIIPYYVYPSEGAWVPLEKLATDNPNVSFTVIVNPASGPGADAVPDQNWRREIPKLASLSNVVILGYIATRYGGRPIDQIERDLKTYAEWPTAGNDANLKVHGIFLDEVAGEPDEKKLAYYRQITATIKGNKGLGPNNRVVLNPGTVPDKAYLDIPDSTVIFESPHNRWQEALKGGLFDPIKNVDKARLASMVTAVPAGTDIRGLVNELRDVSGHVYLTTAASYTEYSTSWEEVARILAA